MKFTTSEHIHTWRMSRLAEFLNDEHDKRARLIQEGIHTREPDWFAQREADALRLRKAFEQVLAKQTPPYMLLVDPSDNWQTEQSRAKLWHVVDKTTREVVFYGPQGHMTHIAWHLNKGGRP